MAFTVNDERKDIGMVSGMKMGKQVPKTKV